jgi:glycosyltransferase involved in cell wall biosynthesis
VKSVHLSTSTTGGAALTAKALVNLQNEFGHDSQFITRDENLKKSLKYRSKLTTFLSLFFAKSEFGQLTHFSTSSLNVKSILELKPDIIFVHNWFNLMSEKDICALNQKIPIIFVAHDARLMTGGCHVTLGCRNFERGCKQCPASRIGGISHHAKKNIDSMVTSLGRYAVVTPSHWLLNEMKASPIIMKAEVSISISNPVQLKSRRIESRQNNSKETFKILFVAASLGSRYKGLRIFLESLVELTQESLFGLILEVEIVGKGKLDFPVGLPPEIQITLHGEMTLEQVQNLMRGADLLVVPSLSENFPGIIGEAQLLGCPVAGSKVGGIPEMIEDNVTGFLFDPNPRDCMLAILRAIKSSSNVSQQAQESAVARHDRYRIFQEYESVIKALTN